MTGGEIDNTPGINATGVYVLYAPWVVEPGAIYRAEAIDGFESLESNDIDVYSRFYQAYEDAGVTVTDYQRDRLNAINIITLMSDTAETIYVPSSFIKEFPRTVTVPYSRLILSVDLGLLPDGISLQTTIENIQSHVSELVGIPHSSNGIAVDKSGLLANSMAAVDDSVKVPIMVHKVTLTNGIDHSTHERLENNRAERVRTGNTEAYFSTIRKLQAQVSSLTLANEALSDIIIKQNESSQN
mgnify:CR=1 FL=1